MEHIKSRGFFTVVDFLFISYLIDTLILAFFIQDSNLRIQALSFRLIAIATILFIHYHHRKENSSITKMIKHFFPLTLLIYMYFESVSFNNIFIPHSIDWFLAEVDFFIFGFLPSFELAKTFDNVIFSKIMSLGNILFVFTFITFISLLSRKDVTNRNESLFVVYNCILFFFFVYLLLPSHGPLYHTKLASNDILGKIGVISNHFYQVHTGSFPAFQPGILVIISIMSAIHFRKFFFFSVVATILVTFSTVYNGMHYAVDVIVSLVLAPLLFFLSLKMLSLITRIMREFWPE